MALYLGNTKINSLQAEYAVSSGVSSVNGQVGAVVIDDMTGATAETSGVSGLVPAPVAGDESKYLKGNGTWAEVSTGLTNLVDGSAEGSVRGTGTLEENQEDYEYTIGRYAFVEGYLTRATGDFSHAEGFGTKALGQNAHAEGDETEASNYNSHAEGYCSKATGHTNHVEGYHTIASGKTGTHVQGMLNVEDTDKTYLHIVGNGTEDFYMNQTRSNAHTIDWDGNAWFAGDVYVGSTSGTNKDSGSKKLATEEYVNTEVSKNAPLVPVASSSATSGVTYISGIIGIEADILNSFCKAISSNSSITNTTTSVYISYGNHNIRLSVGDYIYITIGSAQSSIKATIVGFNHDDLTYSNAYNGTHSKAGITFMTDDYTVEEVTRHSTTQSNANGWHNSLARTSFQTNVFSTLPFSIRLNIKTVNKKTGIGGSANFTTLKTTQDTLFLPSYFEVVGSTNSVTIAGEGSQYCNFINAIPSGLYTRSPHISQTQRYVYYLNSSNKTYVFYGNNEFDKIKLFFCI